jgi:hypothetical protein
MIAEFDPDPDFAQVADRLETVTLRRTDGSASAAITAALRRAVTTREAAVSDGRYTASDLHWHLPASELDAPPRLGDRIVDAAAQCWTILETRLQTCGARWECIARNLALAGGLTSFVTIVREVPVKGASGAVEPTYVPLASAVAARIQELSSWRREEHGRQSGTVEVKIYLAEQILVDNGCRVQAADGTLYEVTGYERPNSITSLFTINAIRRL